MLEKEIESLKKIKLHGGMVGKATLLCIVLILGVSAVCFKASLWWLTIPLMVLMMGIVFYTLKRLFDFADAHPHAAIMDGAELLQHERLSQASKDGVILQLTPAVDHPVQELGYEADIADDVIAIEGGEDPEKSE
ncbi:hypothetical protein P3W23_00360 [Luteibacter sp. PPL554]